jgi:hypothetical protein
LCGYLSGSDIDWGFCGSRRDHAKGEAWAKRRYRAHFVSKPTDADGENGETDTSLDFAHDCGCITDNEHAEMTAECAESGRMLAAMIGAPDKFLTSGL